MNRSPKLNELLASGLIGQQFFDLTPQQQAQLLDTLSEHVNRATTPPETEVQQQSDIRSLIATELEGQPASPPAIALNDDAALAAIITGQTPTN